MKNSNSNHPIYDMYMERNLPLGSYLKDMLVNIERFKWILHRLDTENPSSAVCHDWNCTRNHLGYEMPKLIKAYEKLHDEHDKEPKSIDITTFERNLNECGRLCNKASEYLVASEFYKHEYADKNEFYRTTKSNRVIRDNKTFKILKFLDEED